MAKKRKRSKKWIYWIVLLVLLVAAGVVVYMVWDNYFKSDVEKGDEVTVVQEVKNDEAETAVADEAEVVEKEKVPQYEGGSPNEAEELTGVVTYAGVSDGSLVVRVNIDQYLSEGSCKLALKRGGTVIYNMVAEIVDMVTTSTCDGFEVPVSEVGSGELEVVIELESGDKRGTIRGGATV